MSRNDRNTGVIYGALGTYTPDENDPDDECYGLYLQLGRHKVFVDIKEDKFLEQRRVRALKLFENSATLQESLENFILANPVYASRSLTYIGLHSKDLDQGEVFSDPEGYTLLRGFSFVLE